MHNSEKIIGMKLRELRIKKGITQKALAGDKITRNMLSLIENGTASPSVATLLYLAERLETPPGYFFSFTENDEALYSKITTIDLIKKAFSSKDYFECERLCLELPTAAIDDEIAFILASSYLKTARVSADLYEFSASITDLNKAAFFSDQSIYCGVSFKKAVDYNKELCVTACTENIPELLCSDDFACEYVPLNQIKYFTALKLIQNKENINYIFPYNSPYSKHISAISYIYEGNLYEAITILKELSDTANLPFYMYFRVLCGLEYAANSYGDMKIAYNAARKKLDIIDKCKI